MENMSDEPAQKECPSFSLQGLYPKNQACCPPLVDFPHYITREMIKIFLFGDTGPASLNMRNRRFQVSGVLKLK
jgi:hypothetical protein